MSAVDDDPQSVGGWRGQLVAVTGRAARCVDGRDGTRPGPRPPTSGTAGWSLLADLALDADQAMLHDAGDVVPGVQELVEIHRNARPPAPTDPRSLAFAVTDRHYDLLLGLRRHRDWVTLRPAPFDAALDGLRRAYKAVVADVSATSKASASAARSTSRSAT